MFLRKINKIPFSALLFVLLVTSSCKENKKEAETSSKEIDASTEEHISSLSNLIRVESPRPGEEISSALSIRGKARGTWYFEGDFPIFLLNDEGKEIAVAISVAQGEWMTEEWVEFSATLEFEAPNSEEGVLRFQKSNPSGKPEFDNSLEIPVKFR